MIRAALATLALAAVGAGVAFAAIPDPDGTIHGCYRNAAGPGDDRAGDLRVVDPGPTGRRACEPGETPLDWNQGGLPRVYQAAKHNTKSYGTGKVRPLLGLDLPAGTYSVNAKAVIKGPHNDNKSRSASCDLYVANELVDSSRFDISLAGVEQTTHALQFAGSVAGGEFLGSVLLGCGAGRAPWRARHLKISALEVGEVVRN